MPNDTVEWPEELVLLACNVDSLKSELLYPCQILSIALLQILVTQSAF